jgi:hypothetical protein
MTLRRDSSKELVKSASKFLAPGASPIGETEVSPPRIRGRIRMAHSSSGASDPGSYGFLKWSPNLCPFRIFRARASFSIFLRSVLTYAHLRPYPILSCNPYSRHRSLSDRCLRRSSFIPMGPGQSPVQLSSRGQAMLAGPPTRLDAFVPRLL